ncbi:hypothetical protein RRG08_029948 [Elysia crispata]|uniref:Uncharacterized protein n=1 Tax=Elysia crispata TaxID=231223 RepID=A0AAE1DI46_9GAST|nr:hypothetical protein RRG08_029948 [Elysia crispata]
MKFPTGGIRALTDEIDNFFSIICYCNRRIVELAPGCQHTAKTILLEYTELVAFFYLKEADTDAESFHCGVIIVHHILKLHKNMEGVLFWSRRYL